MELRNFVYFFDVQLRDSEKSIYTSNECATMFPGFKVFVLKFLLRMAKVGLFVIQLFTFTKKHGSGLILNIDWTLKQRLRFCCVCK